MFKGRKVVVTGGAGFIGSHIADRLVAEGAEVTIVDNLSTGFREFANAKARLVEGDLLDGEIRLRSDDHDACRPW
mgnify:CR=1 FL=1